MGWKTTVLWDESDTTKNDLRDHIFMALAEKYAEFYKTGPMGDPIRTFIDDSKHQKIERFWKDEESARFVIDTIIKYLSDAGLGPVSTSIDYIPE